MKIISPTTSFGFKSTNRAIRKRNLCESVISSHPVLKNPNVDYHSNFTYFFREDVAKNWGDFVKILREFYKHSKKVNVYNFACSDGSESYSLVMMLISQLRKKEAEKFFPIQAFDIDPEIIRRAKSDRIPCDMDDIMRINDNVKRNKRFCAFLNTGGYNSPCCFVPKEVLKNKIDFKNADFVEEIDKLDFSNSLIMCRNLWYYLGEDNIYEILSKLYEKIDDTSLLVIGDFDRRYILKYLTAFGFVEVGLNIFRKTTN